jgi:hypothetical protein
LQGSLCLAQGPVPEGAKASVLVGRRGFAKRPIIKNDPWMLKGNGAL